MQASQRKPDTGASTTLYDLAWVAGIIDGEGTIRIARKLNRGRPSYTLIVKVDMTHQPTIARLRRIFGCGADYKGEGTNKPAFIVQWNGEEAYKVLKAIQPFSYTKTHEVDLGIEFWEKCSGVFNATGVPSEIDLLRQVIYEELKEAK